MISKWRWFLLHFTRRLWVRATLFAVLGIATALGSIMIERFIPWDLPGRIGADAVNRILDILATSMLAVTTFSLSIMVQAYGAATSNGSPRATRLVMEDSTTQNVLATFIGSFLFSLVGIVTLAAGAYGDRGRVVLYVVTLAVIAIIVATILRWIDHLSRLGRVGETLDRVEAAAADAMAVRSANPCLGGRPLSDPNDIPSRATSVLPARIGYVQHIDAAGLSDVAERHACRVFVEALPGTFVHPSRALARVAADDGGAVPDEVEQAVRGTFTIADERSFDQDPRFGLVVLSEIASRALSPAVNDPGTAIDVIGRAVRILARWADRRVDAEEAAFDRVRVPPLAVDDLFDDVFTPIARDGAALIEVQMRLQKGLVALGEMADPDLTRAARRHAGLALRRAEAAMTLAEDRERIERVVAAHQARD